MEWWEKLALEERQKELGDRLYCHVPSLIDLLARDFLVDLGGIEYGRIMSSPVAHDQVREVLRMLFQRDGDVDAFSKFCQAIRAITINEPTLASQADLLEAQARECKRTGSEEKVANCSLALPFELRNEVDPVKVAAALQERERACIAKFRKHLLSVCKSECCRSHPMAEMQQQDVRTAYVSMQAMSQREARRYAHRHKQKAGSGTEVECDDGTESFSLREPSQLLLDNPTCAEVSSALKTSVRKPRKTMIMSDAGKGKTKLCQRVLLDFLEEERVGLQEQFDFVIWIEVRGSSGLSSHDWQEFLGLHHPHLDEVLSGEERRVIMKHLSENSERILLVIDGIDEGSTEAFCTGSAARAFMECRNSKLMEASAIVTSRPCEQAYDVVAKCTAHYRLTGFTEAQLDEFCCRQLGEAEGKMCMSQLLQPSRKHLRRTIQSTPLLGALLCQQYFMYSKIPTCTTLFYVGYVCAAISRLATKRGKPFAPVRLTRGVDSELCGGRRFMRDEKVSLYAVVEHRLEQFVQNDDVVAEGEKEAVAIAKALQDLYVLSIGELRQRRYLVFRPSQLPEESAKWCIDLGLLFNTKDYARSFEADRRVAFPHLTMQEWCAARGGASADDVVANAKDYLQCFGIPEERWEFWKFLLGTVSGEITGIVAVMKEAGKFDGFLAKKFQLFLMRCLSENRLAALGLDAGSVGETLDSRRYVAAASTLVEGGVNLSAFSLDDMDTLALCDTMQLAQPVDDLDLRNCNLSEEQVASLSPVLHCARQVQLESSRLSGAPLEAIAKSLGSSSSRGVEGLHLGKAELLSPERDGPSLALCCQHSTLAVLDVHSTKLGNAGLSVLARHMSRSRSLKVLKASDCGLRSGCGGDLATLFRLLPSLEGLAIFQNKLTTADAALALSALESHRHLKKIDFNCNCLDNSLSRSLAEFFQARRHLSAENESKSVRSSPATGLPPCEVHLSRNTLVTADLLQELADSGVCGHDEVHMGGSVATLASVKREDIKSLVQQHGGKLSSYVSSEGLSALGAFLSTDASLKRLSISHSQLSNSGIASFAMSGPSGPCSSLRLIDVGDNDIHLSGAAALLDAFRESALQCLCLYRNPIFTDADASSGDYDLFFAALSDFKDLKCFTLGETGVSHDVIKKLMATVKNMKCLRFLDFADNGLDDHAAEEFVAAMNAGSCLEIVDLTSNAITDAGVQSLLECQAVMKMEHVWLAGNPVSDELLRRPLASSGQLYGAAFLMDYIQLHN